MTLETSTTYGYSATTGRLETVSGNSSGTFTYGYETNSGLIKTVTRPGLLETQPALRVTNTWDPARDVLLTKANELVSGETVTDVSSITYTVNPIGQRTHATRTGAATNGTEWGYDTLGQLETADDTNPAADRAYQYDSIGNRLSRSVGVPPTSTATYTPNALNQYDAITEGTVTFTPTYDDDGNQKDAQIQPLGSSGPASCVYHWDAENRLTSVTSQGGEVLVSYLYDAQSRLISRSVGVSPTTTTAYIHDGWNRIAEYTVTLGDPNATPPTETVTTLSKTYLWGTDLSGSFQGAGGVGGLLSVSAHDPETGNITSVHYPTCDGSGNITEYLTAAGDVAAHFEYDPFGNTLAATGDAAQFEYRFSTKPQDAATGLYYYGYRWYDPLTGRWPSRDPIEEIGGVNLYGFVGNDGVDQVDILGQEVADPTTEFNTQSGPMSCICAAGANIVQLVTKKRVSEEEVMDALIAKLKKKFPDLPPPTRTDIRNGTGNTIIRLQDAVAAALEACGDVKCEYKWVTLDEFEKIRGPMIVERKLVDNNGHALVITRVVNGEPYVIDTGKVENSQGVGKCCREMSTQQKIGIWKLGLVTDVARVVTQDGRPKVEKGTFVRIITCKAK